MPARWGWGTARYRRRQASTAAARVQIPAIHFFVFIASSISSQLMLAVPGHNIPPALARSAGGTYPHGPPHIHGPVRNHFRECCCLKGNIEERACRLALYIIENKATVRGAAQKFGISKSTVHKDLSERLPAFNRSLYLQVKGVLDENKAERHIRGGIATRKKYRGE